MSGRKAEGSCPEHLRLQGLLALTEFRVSRNLRLSAFYWAAVKNFQQ